MKTIKRTAAVSAGPAAAASNALRLPLRTQLRSMRLLRAFTLIEVVFIMGTVFLLFLIIPSMTKTKCRSSRISCTSNIKQIGLAFRMWANDNGEKFPMAALSAEGGTREAIMLGLPFSSFSIISNELNNPKPLTCADDKKRERATEFPKLTPKNLSYFLGVDASEVNPQTILSGDRNLCINGQPTYRFLQTTNWSAITWGPSIHKHQGNIGLADGSAHQVTDRLLQRQLQATGLTTNRFAIP